jgi:hypothetical protein
VCLSPHHSIVNFAVIQWFWICVRGQCLYLNDTNTNVTKLNSIWVDSLWSDLVLPEKKLMKNYWPRGHFKPILLSSMQIRTIYWRYMSNDVSIWFSTKLNSISIDSPWSVLVLGRKKSMKNYWPRVHFKSILLSSMQIRTIFWRYMSNDASIWFSTKLTFLSIDYPWSVLRFYLKKAEL